MSTEKSYKALLAEMTETLAGGHDVAMHGVGKFSVTRRTARKGKSENASSDSALERRDIKSCC